MLRPFLRIGVGVDVRRAHRELAGRDQDQLHANRVGIFDRDLALSGPAFLQLPGGIHCPGVRRHRRRLSLRDLLARGLGFLPTAEQAPTALGLLRRFG